MRCKTCRRRFFASSDATSAPAAKTRPSRGTNKLISARRKRRIARRLVVISIFAVAFAVFWLFLRYLTTERVPSDSSAIHPPLSRHYS
jgi:hypothetical protein